MKKTKQTQKIIREWRKFENMHRLNESQSGSINTTRVRHTPSKAAKELLKELEGDYGNDIFYCYDRFDGHGDDEMINEEYGYQIEIEALTDHVKSMSGFPSDISVSDIVMTEDDLIYGNTNRDLNVNEQGTFDVPWPTGPYQGDSQRYYHGEIDINGRKHKIVYKNEHGYTIYYMWAGVGGVSSKPSKQFKSRLGGAWG